jgi:hypothetical protein
MTRVGSWSSYSESEAWCNELNATISGAEHRRSQQALTLGVRKVSAPIDSACATRHVHNVRNRKFGQGFRKRWCAQFKWDSSYDGEPLKNT